MEGLMGLAPFRVELAVRDAEPAVGGVAEPEARDVVEIDELAGAFPLLHGGEQIHVVRAVGLDPQLELEIAGQFGVFGEGVREDGVRLGEAAS